MHFAKNILHSKFKFRVNVTLIEFALYSIEILFVRSYSIFYHEYCIITF